jgi:uncharacterized protein
VSKLLPNREQAVRILKDNNCPPQVISHCLVVADFAQKTAHRLQMKGVKVDLPLVEAGAVLHDLGRSKTHSVDHAPAGAQIARTLGLSQPIIDIIKRHVGAGITPHEAERLGWPQDNYVPQTLEEKIVCYADKRIDHDKVVPIEIEIQRLQNGGLAEAAERVRRLHTEITDLLGEQL